MFRTIVIVQAFSLLLSCNSGLTKHDLDELCKIIDAVSEKEKNLLHAEVTAEYSRKRNITSESDDYEKAMLEWMEKNGINTKGVILSSPEQRKQLNSQEYMVDITVYNKYVKYYAYNIVGNKKVPIETSVYNGEISKKLRYKPNPNGLMKTNGYVSEGRSELSYEQYDPVHFLVQGQLGTFLKDVFKRKKIKTETSYTSAVLTLENDNQRINDDICYLLTIDMSGIEYYKFWISKELLLPLRIEHSDPNLRIIKELEYKKYTDGVVYPGNSTINIFTKGNNDEDFTLFESIILHVTEFKPTNQTETSRFNLVFPSGAYIHNRIHGKSYIVE